MTTEDRARVAQELPPYGARVRGTALVELSRLPAPRAWGALIALCCDGIATARDGWVTRGRDTEAGTARRRAA